MVLLNPGGKTKVSREKLEKLGFNFKYYTHIYETLKGVRYFYCYDYGYLPINDREILLIIQNKQ